MRLVRRRPPAEGFNHELIWLVVSVAAVVAGGVWLGLGLPWLGCPFRAVTGYPCLTCGATRCAIAFSHGHLSTAWSWNPLAFIALCGVALFDLYAVAVLLARGPRLRVIDWTRAEKNAVRVAVVVLIAVNWAYLVAHRARY
ncbi:MAG: DUF2752 domain-containing protein [Verrucomicrobiota bacterium]|nr:DUF2752 domain-containing protein [Verrucomicrobiota bacterium]